MTVSDGVSPSPKGGGGGAGSPPLNPPLQAQWLGCRSLAGQTFPALHQICVSQVTTLWVNCPLWVGQLSLPSLWIPPCIYMDYRGWDI